MTFSRDSVRKIEAGRKTATTRVSGRYRIGGTYTINPYPAKNPKARFDKAVGYIRVIEKMVYSKTEDRERMPASRIAEHYWHMEGFGNRTQCYHRLEILGLDKANILYVYRFKYVGKTDPRKRERSKQCNQL